LRTSRTTFVIAGGQRGAQSPLFRGAEAPDNPLLIDMDGLELRQWMSP
jgi:hypothetical protein